MKSILEIQNLKCGGCANTIINQLSKLDGVSEVEVDNNNNEVSFKNTNESTLINVEKKLSDLGYPIKGEANSLPKKAKSFVSCAVGKMTK